MRRGREPEVPISRSTLKDKSYRNRPALSFDGRARRMRAPSMGLSLLSVRAKPRRLMTAIPPAILREGNGTGWGHEEMRHEREQRPTMIE